MQPRASCAEADLCDSLQSPWARVPIWGSQELFSMHTWSQHQQGSGAWVAVLMVSCS